MATIYGHKSEQVQVSVTFSTLADAICSELRHRFAIPGDAYLDEAGRMVCEERGWRHGSVGVDVLSPAPTDDQVMGLKLINDLNSLVRRFEREALETR